MRDLPDELRAGVFTRQRALELHVTSRMLDGRRFVRVLPRVYRLADHEMTHADWTRAAALALPDRAHLTGISRLQALGLDHGPRLPVRYVVEGDLHLAVPQVFLHRTRRLPPLDADGVRPDAAFLAYCARARVLDAIKVGDWLLHHGHVDPDALRALALAELWRAGADEALWVLDHLDPRSRSLKESELRAVLTFAGLPDPEVNAALDLDGHLVVADLLYRRWGLVVEYEGRHHQTERAQYSADLDRYALLRGRGLGYVQVTSERLDHARTLVGTVFRELLSRGYDGPVPEFGVRWEQLHGRVSWALGPRRLRRAG